MQAIEQSNCCNNCVALNKECQDLREHVNILTSRIDKLSDLLYHETTNILFRRTSDSCTQTIESNQTVESNQAPANLSEAASHTATDNTDNILYNLYSSALLANAVDADGHTTCFDNNIMNNHVPFKCYIQISHLKLSA